MWGRAIAPRRSDFSPISVLFQHTGIYSCFLYTTVNGSLKVLFFCKRIENRSLCFHVRYEVARNMDGTVVEKAGSDSSLYPPVKIDLDQKLRKEEEFYESLGE